MRAAFAVGLVWAYLVLANLAPAQAVLEGLEPDVQQLPGVDSDFEAALRTASLLQQPAPYGAQPPSEAESPPSDTALQETPDPFSEETSSDVVSPCPRCHCLCCKCPEPAQPCQECPRVNNVNPAWSLILGGWVTMDSLYNSARPIAPGTPFFLAPEAIFNEDTFDIHARQTTIYLAAKGPRVGKYEAGGLIMFNLYNDSIVVDRYGFLPYQAWGELKNEHSRIAAGLQVDIFAPVLPTVLPFSYLAASGNAGVYRGQLRFERFYHPSRCEQITLTAGISDANPTILNEDVLSEDNGWPNVEARAAWAVGELKQEGLAAVRPFEVGVSGVFGEVRSTQIAMVQVIDDVWGLAFDYRWRVNQKWGFQGEIFTGQGLGTYGGGILQTVNSVTFETIETSGGWAEVYFYCTPCVHTHWGYGIDNPDDGDLALGQISRNDTFFANLIWDVTKSFRLGFEFTYRETEYIVLTANDGIGLHGQMQWKF